MPLINEIIDGRALEQASIPLLSILPHIKCPKCGDDVQAKDPASLMMLTISGYRSANVKNRLDGLEHLAKYGMGPGKDVTVEIVTEKLKEQAEVLRGELSGEAYERVIGKLKKVWTS